MVLVFTTLVLVPGFYIFWNFFKDSQRFDVTSESEWIQTIDNCSLNSHSCFPKLSKIGENVFAVILNLKFMKLENNEQFFEI